MQSIFASISAYWKAIRNPRAGLNEPTTGSLLPRGLIGFISILLIASAILLITALAGAGNFADAIESYAERYELSDDELPEFSTPTSTAWRFPVTWLALLVWIAVVRFLTLTVLSDSRGRSDWQTTLSLTAHTLGPFILVGLIAGLLANLFPSSGEFSTWQLARVWSGVVLFIVAMLYEAYATVIAYRAIFDQNGGRAALVFLAPWLGIVCVAALISRGGVAVSSVRGGYLWGPFNGKWPRGVLPVGSCTVIRHFLIGLDDFDSPVLINMFDANIAG